MLVVPYWLCFTVPVVVSLGILLGGGWITMTPLLIFVLIPILDRVGGVDTVNPPELDPKKNRDFWRDMPLWAWAPPHLAVTAWACWEVGSGRYSGVELLGLAFSVGITGVIGINAAHELMHRRGKTERALAEILMTSVSYTHFCVEHVHGHHRYVATPRDPASSRRGETVYRFWPRSAIGGVRSFLEIEGRRVAKRGRGFLGLGDRRVRYSLLVLATYAAAFAFTGWRGALFFAAQSLVAVLFLETINYIEHYGLERRTKEDGKYERVQPQHSWNASERLTNWYLFNLQRHSDHHYLASRPYWQLRHYDDVPQLPFGYATAILVSFVPRLWFRVMNPRVEAWREAGAGDGGASVDEAA